MMCVCYWCYWGWPRAIREIYDACVSRAGESAMRWGPAHIVWEDENWDSAQWCLDTFDEWVRDWNGERYTVEQLSVVRESLECLVSVSDEFKHEPEGYDDENPEAFPPPLEWGCERR